MTVAPLLAAPMLVQLHAFAALSALLLGLVQFAAPKGVTLHRLLGWVWVTLMATVALTALGITGEGGRYSVIHLFVLFALVLLPVAVIAARRHRVPRHRRVMIGLFLGALVIAGVFTLLPGRLMGRVVFGG